MAESAPTVSTARSASFIDPATLMTIRNLEFRSRVVVEGFWHGLHRSPFHGFSVEFTEYRQYTPGDDTRYLDWRLYARTDRYYLRKFEDETNLRCHLVVDNSRSMTFGSVGYTKSDYANTLAATLSYFLYLQGDAVGLLTFDEALRDYLPPRHRRGHLRQIMLALEKPAGGKETDLAGPLRRIVDLVRKRGVVVFISDFLAPIETLKQEMSALAACGHEVVVFHVLDPVEASLDIQQASMFLDLESGRQLYIEPGKVRERYQARLGDHCQAVEALCSKLGVAYHRFTTERPLELALFDFMKDRLQRGKRRGRRKERFGP